MFSFITWLFLELGPHANDWLSETHDFFFFFFSCSAPTPVKVVCESKDAKRGLAECAISFLMLSSASSPVLPAEDFTSVLW